MVESLNLMLKSSPKVFYINKESASNVPIQKSETTSTKTVSTSQAKAVQFI